MKAPKKPKPAKARNAEMQRRGLLGAMGKCKTQFQLVHRVAKLRRGQGTEDPETVLRYGILGLGFLRSRYRFWRELQQMLEELPELTQQLPPKFGQPDSQFRGWAIKSGFPQRAGYRALQSFVAACDHKLNTPSKAQDWYGRPLRAYVDVAWTDAGLKRFLNVSAREEAILEPFRPTKAEVRRAALSTEREKFRRRYHREPTLRRLQKLLGARHLRVSLDTIRRDLEKLRQ